MNILHNHNNSPVIYLSSSQLLHYFSVSSEVDNNKRYIVTYTHGISYHQSRWKCLSSGCRNAINCAHRKMALLFAEEQEYLVSDTVEKPLTSANTSVSFIEVAPPRSVLLDNEKDDWAQRASFSSYNSVLFSAPKRIKLSAHSQCVKGHKNSCNGPSSLSSWKKVTLFTELKAFDIEIEICPCSHPDCTSNGRSYYNIGPDCSEQGIFNRNNENLFSHALLDSFTEYLTSRLEGATFTNFLDLMTSSYISYNSAKGPPSKKSFIAV